MGIIEASISNPLGGFRGAASFERLVPDLARACEMSRAVRLAGIMGALFDQLGFAVLVIDAGHAIAFMNAAARELLAQPNSGFVMKGGMIAPARAVSARLFSDRVAEACRCAGGGDLLVSTSRAGEPELRMAVSVSPLADVPADAGGGQGPYALILIRALTLDLEPDFPARLRALFGLAPKEANLAAVLTAGYCLKDASAKCGIRVSTARSYLENIFDKVGVRQQSHLIAVLKTAEPMVRRR